jgi:nucleotide-binding universal stress UspA family protein
MSAVSSIPPSAPFCIVVGVDFTDAGGFAFREAACIAQRIPASQLHLVHVFEDTPSEEEAQALRGRLRTYVNEQAASVGALDRNTVGVHLRAGSPALEILRLAAEVGADLIVLGACRGPHLKSWLIGSVAETLMGATACPVVVAGPKPTGEARQRTPAIDPPCPACMEIRNFTRGSTWWCTQHAHHAQAAHSFSYRREVPLSTPDTLVTPAGVSAP